jgi:hypothetical protein
MLEFVAVGANRESLCQWTAYLAVEAPRAPNEPAILMPSIGIKKTDPVASASNQASAGAGARRGGAADGRDGRQDRPIANIWSK